MFEGYLTDVEGIKVGHFGDLDAMTGCTAVICEGGATGGVDVRGSAPGTRETDLFQERKSVDKVHGIILSGGSAFGLDAASGAMRFLADKDIGFDTGIVKVPIVASAVIFDLAIGNPSVRPDFEFGYQASKTASSSEKRQGNIGCGLGATVGKILGTGASMKSGLGSASVKVGDLVVSALVVVNAIGDVFNLNNEKIAGVYDYEKSQFLDTIDIMKTGYINNIEGKNTTIGIIATNGILNKAQGNKIAEVGHNAYAKTINPVHTSYDGDTIFTMATNKVPCDVDLVGVLGVEAMSKAIINAIKSSKSYKNIKAFEDINR